MYMKIFIIYDGKFFWHKSYWNQNLILFQLNLQQKTDNLADFPLGTDFFAHPISISVPCFSPFHSNARNLLLAGAAESKLKARSISTFLLEIDQTFSETSEIRSLPTYYSSQVIVDSCSDSKKFANRAT